MFKHGFGTTAVKYQFTIDLKEVILPDMFDEFDGTETLCIAFERKNKGLSYTEEKKISLNDNDEIIADFTNESFTSDVTLYRDKSGFVREKTGTLTLLQRKYGTSGSTREAFKAIGMAHIPFHQFTDNQAHQKELFFGGIVSHSARIVCVIAGVAKDGGQPINPSGTNDPDDGDSLASKSLTSTASQLNHNSTSFSTKPTDPSSVTTVAKTNVPFTLGASSSNTTTSTTKSSSTFFSLNKKSSHNEDKEKEKDTIQTQSMLSFHSSDDAKFENSFLYQNMKRRVEELEDSMLASAEIMDFDKAKIKELTQHMRDIESENDSLKQQSNDLHFQMEHLQTDYEILMRENESLKATIAKYTLEGGKLQSLLQKATDELNIQQDAKFKLEQLLKEKNDECEDLLAELIKTKVAVGDLNGELDETKKQLRILRGGGRGGSAPAGGGGGGGGGPGAPRGPGEMTDRRPPQPQSNGVPRERVPSSDMGNRPAPPSNSQPYNNPQYSTPNYNNNPGPAQGRQRQGVSSTDYYMNNGNYTPSVGNNNGYSSNPSQSGYNSNNPTQNGYNSNQNVTNSSRGGPGPGAGPDYYSYNNTSNNNMNGSSSRPSISQPPPAPASSSRAFIPSQGYGNPTPSQSQSTNSNGNSFTSSIKRGFGGW